MLYLGICEKNKKNRRFVRYGLGAVARFFPFLDERTGRYTIGIRSWHIPFELTATQAQIGARI
jgi:hypothetical protein